MRKKNVKIHTVLTGHHIAYWKLHMFCWVSTYLLSEKDTMDVWCNGQNIETAVSMTTLTEIDLLWIKHYSTKFNVRFFFINRRYTFFILSQYCLSISIVWMWVGEFWRYWLKGRLPFLTYCILKPDGTLLVELKVLLKNSTAKAFSRNHDQQLMIIHRPCLEQFRVERIFFLPTPYHCTEGNEKLMLLIGRDANINVSIDWGVTLASLSSMSRWTLPSAPWCSVFW